VKVKVVAIITLIMLLMVMSVPVYAETTLPAPPSDAYQYWVYMKTNAGEIHFITAKSPITVINESGTNVKIRNGKTYCYVNNNWVFSADVGNGNASRSDWVMVAANHDIAYEDGTGFFFECPKVNPLVQTMEATDFGAILKNFSVGLIPIVGLIVSFIAFRKAWAFLRNQLQS